MHQEALAFVRDALAVLDMTGLAVLEFGSLNVNGSVRPYCAGCARYVGVDVREGPDVDVVARAQDYTADEPFDLVISTETLEHDSDPEGILASAWRALRPGGTLIVTAAAEPRAPHACDGGPVVPKGEHYANIDPDALREWLGDWADVQIVSDGQRGDVYALATRPDEKANTTKRRKASSSDQS